jgi:hypothetical protein
MNFNRMKLKQGTKVDVPLGMESRVVATIVSGPHRYTDAEIEDNKRVNEECGYSTNRMCRSYYKMKWGRQRLTISTNAIKEV